MTYQVKEGDVLEYRGDGELKSVFPFQKGKTYKVENNGNYLFIRSEGGHEASTVLSVFPRFGFHLVTAPPATIQHEGYNYTRGEPVVPEWVKDGAWVVNICSGELRKVKEIKPGVFDLAVNDLASIRYQDVIRDQYRPFTNADWKWGMWAEYKGEKVFVMNGIDKSGYVEISGKPISLKTLDGWNLAPASELTPTTAP